MGKMVVWMKEVVIGEVGGESAVEGSTGGIKAVLTFESTLDMFSGMSRFLIFFVLDLIVGIYGAVIVFNIRIGTDVEIFVSIVDICVHIRCVHSDILIMCLLYIRFNNSNTLWWNMGMIRRKFLIDHLINIKCSCLPYLLQSFNIIIHLCISFLILFRFKKNLLLNNNLFLHNNIIIFSIDIFLSVCFIGFVANFLHGNVSNTPTTFLFFCG